MEQMRPSILRRPLRPTSCTKESAEEQYRREQEAIAAKGRRLMATEARLMGSLYPTPVVQNERMQDFERTRQEQLAAHAAERRRQEEVVASFADIRPTTAPPPARPWEGATYSYSSRSEQESARKQFESQVADENRRTALAKSLERQQQRQAEAAEVRQQMQQARGNFWNLGAVPGTGRYIAPEHRWVAASADNYTPMLSRPSSTPASPRVPPLVGSAPWATSATGAPTPAAAPAPYSGLRAPYATTVGRDVTAPASPAYRSAAPAPAAYSVPGVKPSGLSPPWATYSPKAAAPAVSAVPAPAAAAASAPCSPGSLQGRELSRDSGSFVSRNAGSVMAGLLYGEASESMLHHKQRPGTAAAVAEGAEKLKYPWEWSQR